LVGARSTFKNDVAPDNKEEEHPHGEEVQKQASITKSKRFYKVKSKEIDKNIADDRRKARD
jgi:hypothetical protein